MLKALGAATIAISLLALPAFAEDTKQPASGVRVATVASIPNFAAVTPKLYRGSAPTEAGIRALAKSGVRTIIDLRMNPLKTRREHDIARSVGITYIRLPMNYMQPSEAQLHEFLNVVQNPVYQPVFVHCRQGADRTGTLVAVYRILIQKWTLAKAYKEMRQHGFKPWLFTLKRAVKTCSASAEV